MIIDKEVYSAVVKNTVKMMVSISKENSQYHLHEELIEYFQKTIKNEGVLNEQEYVTICNNIIRR